MSNQSISGGNFDGGVTSVPSAGAWTRILTLDTLQTDAVIGMEIVPTVNPVKLRLTRASQKGKPHGLLQTDLTQPSRNVLLSTINGSGTQNQPNAGDIVSLNIFTEGCAELGVEAQATSSGAATAQAYGGVNQ